MVEIVLIVGIVFYLSMFIFPLPLHKLGIPLYLDDVRWTWFVYRNIKKAKIINENYLIYDGKIIAFYESWLWNVYVGNSPEEIKYKYSVGGQSNRASYLTWWQKAMGNKIEKWYLKKIENMNGKINWVTIIERDWSTYPKEGYEVLVSDGKNYDVAYYIMSGEFKWVKVNVLEDDIDDFNSFVVTKWAYID